MKHNNFGRFILVIVIVLWAFWEMYPLTSSDLIKKFKERARNPDASYSAITNNIDVLQKTGTNSEYSVLLQAIGTNDVRPYFPGINTKNQANPTTYILNRVQRSTLGKIKLGLDLQGGTAFLVEMDTNVLLQTDTNVTAGADERTSQAISQATSGL